MTTRMAKRMSAGATALAASLPLAASLLAQTPDTVSRAAAVVPAITEADLASPLAVLAADSLRQRATPSRGLEAAARYVAAAFQRLGLTPGVKDASAPSWIQRYPIPGQRRVDNAQSDVGFILNPLGHGHGVVDEVDNAAQRWVSLNFAHDAYFAPEVGPQVFGHIVFNPFTGLDGSFIGKHLTVLSGPHTVASVQRAAGELGEHVVLYVPAADVAPAVRRQIIAALYAATQGVMIMSGDDSTAFASAAQEARRQPARLADDYGEHETLPRQQRWAAMVWVGAVRPVLESAELDLARLRAEPTPAIREVPAISVLFYPRELDAKDLVTAPNVVGLLQGSDPKRNGEYVVISTDLDTEAATAGDTAAATVGRARGANTGVAVLLAVAKAFSQPEARPARSVLFVAFSGGARAGFAGASYFAGHAPPWSRDHLVADLHLGGFGRAPGDSLWIDGLREVKLTARPEWISTDHPELGVAIADGGSLLQAQADCYAFVRLAVPSLYLHAEHATERAIGPPQAGAPATADAEYLARVARYAFYLGRELSTAPRAPKWTSDARARLRTLLVP